MIEDRKVEINKPENKEIGYPDERKHGNPVAGVILDFLVVD